MVSKYNTERKYDRRLLKEFILATFQIKGLAGA
jgi:hypothetical protein